MKGRLKVKVDREPRAFFRAFMAAEEPIARAATAAVSEAGDRIKAAARADIAAAGFSRKWQNALRVDRYPGGREVSVNLGASVVRIDTDALIDDPLDRIGNQGLETGVWVQVGGKLDDAFFQDRRLKALRITRIVGDETPAF